MSIYSTNDCSKTFLYYFITTYVIYLKTNIFVCRQLNKESKERQLGVAFINPQMFSAAIIDQDPDHIKSTISEVLKLSIGISLTYHIYCNFLICDRSHILLLTTSITPNAVLSPPFEPTTIFQNLSGTRDQFSCISLTTRILSFHDFTKYI